MKRLLIMFAILALAIVAMPAFATEAIGPPGVTAVPADFDAVLSTVAVQVQKEFNAVDSDSIVVSTYAVPDVVPGFPRPVIGLAFVAEENALDKSLTVQSDTRPSLGAVA